MDGLVHDLPDPSRRTSKEDKGVGYVVILLQVPSRVIYGLPTRLLPSSNSRKWQYSSLALVTISYTNSEMLKTSSNILKNKRSEKVERERGQGNKRAGKDTVIPDSALG